MHEAFGFTTINENRPFAPGFADDAGEAARLHGGLVDSRVPCLSTSGRKRDHDRLLARVADCARSALSPEGSNTWPCLRIEGFRPVP